jgi:hypothetical protein
MEVALLASVWGCGRIWAMYQSLLKIYTSRHPSVPKERHTPVLLGVNGPLNPPKAILPGEADCGGQG